MKVLDWSNLKAFAENTVKVAKMGNFALERFENIVGKGENDGYFIFSLFATISSNSSFLMVEKSFEIVW